jgi:hypothetical protein
MPRRFPAPWSIEERQESFIALLIVRYFNFSVALCMAYASE